MSNNMSAGETYGKAEAKAENAAGAVKDTANQAKDKVADAAEATEGQAQLRKEEASGILQQTGEQVANMAQGAYDGVKNTLGVGENQK
ncbi:putative malate dehydrogenase (decarboxylating) [Helianthus anomalus]